MSSAKWYLFHLGLNQLTFNVLMKWSWRILGKTVDTHKQKNTEEWPMCKNKTFAPSKYLELIQYAINWGSNILLHSPKQFNTWKFNNRHNTNSYNDDTIIKNQDPAYLGMNKQEHVEMCNTVPLGQPRSIYRSNIECRFLKFWAKWPNDLEGQGQWPPFSIPPERIPRYIFGATFMILDEIHYRYKLLHGQATFPRILSK